VDTDAAPDNIDAQIAASNTGARSYSLAEVAAAYLPPEWDGVLWLSRRLNTGQINGYKLGRTWRMTHHDVAAFIDSHRKPKPAPKPDTEPTPTAPAVSVVDGLSRRSRARIARGTGQP
jgi:hypothetical protein